MMAAILDVTQLSDPIGPVIRSEAFLSRYADTMAECSANPMAADTKLTDPFSYMNPLQRDIYCYLLNNQRQTAVSIARGVNQRYAKDVNPDLNAMKKMGLLEYSTSDKVWDMTASARASDIGTKAECGRTTATESDVKRIQLTELQERIYAFLKSNKPSRALSIAKGVGKTKVKDVNPDLYKMKNVRLLNHNEQENLWTINTGLAHTLGGSPTSRTDDSTTDQTYIETNGCKDIRRDSGIGVTSSPPDDTARDESNGTGSPAGECYPPCGSPTCPQNIIKNYNIHIEGCRYIMVGDGSWMRIQHPESGKQDYECRGNVPYGPGRSSDFVPGETPDHHSGPLPEAPDWTVPYHRNTGPFEAHLTSSPASCCMPTLNIARVCDELKDVSLDEPDNGDEE